MGVSDMASLGQVEKRLEIIKIAITITDQETIDLQRLKLRRHRDNKQLAAILEVIDDTNYAQASHLIERYLGASSYGQEKKVKREVTQESYMRAAKDKEEEDLIKQFGLFREPGRRESASSIFDGDVSTVPQNTVEIDFSNDESDLISVEEDNKQNHKKPLTTEEIIAQYETIMTDNIPEKVSIPTSVKSNDIQRNEAIMDDEEVESDTRLDDTGIDNIEIDIEEYEIEEFKIEQQPYVEQTPYIEAEEDKESIQNDIESFDAKFNRELEKQFKHVDIQLEDVNELIEDEKEIVYTGSADEIETSKTYETPKTDETLEADKAQETKDTKSPYIEDDIEYEPISYIDQKVRNMLNQYPQIVENVECFDSEEKLLHKISLDGYSEQDIRQTIDHIYRLSDEGKLDEASHLLLIVASTESLYAQFILARELFKGKILQKNVTEAFTQINQLAQDQYPEAICDLAQFYEHGIGTNKNRKKAFRLYEDAYDLGVDRADKHLTKMEEESKGILAKLFNKNR